MFVTLSEIEILVNSFMHGIREGDEIELDLQECDDRADLTESCAVDYFVCVLFRISGCNSNL